MKDSKPNSTKGGRMDVVERVLVSRAIRAGAPLRALLARRDLAHAKWPRVAAPVTATAAATSSNEIGSTTFGRATKRKWATGWGGVGTSEIQLGTAGEGSPRHRCSASAWGSRSPRRGGRGRGRPPRRAGRGTCCARPTTAALLYEVATPSTTGQPPCMVSGLCSPSATTLVILRTGAWQEGEGRGARIGRGRCVCGAGGRDAPARACPRPATRARSSLRRQPRTPA